MILILKCFEIICYENTVSNKNKIGTNSNCDTINGICFRNSINFLLLFVVLSFLCILCFRKLIISCYLLEL